LVHADPEPETVRSDACGLVTSSWRCVEAPDAFLWWKYTPNSPDSGYESPPRASSARATSYRNPVDV
jgi:hypothetical protein